MKFSYYEPEENFDEYFASRGQDWPWAEKVIDSLHQLSKSEWVSRQKRQKRLLWKWKSPSAFMATRRD